MILAVGYILTDLANGVTHLANDLPTVVRVAESRNLLPVLMDRGEAVVALTRNPVEPLMQQV